MHPFPPQMKHIALSLKGEPAWDAARDAAYDYACQDDNDPMLMAWFDRTAGTFSPSCCKCDIKEGPAWEIYGMNHGGRLRISVNDDLYVFIYT